MMEEVGWVMEEEDWVMGVVDLLRACQEVYVWCLVVMLHEFISRFAWVARITAPAPSTKQSILLALVFGALNNKLPTSNCLWSFQAYRHTLT